MKGVWTPGVLVTPLLLSVPALSDADDSLPQEKESLSAATFSGLKLRSIGPALMSGRISDVAIDPVQPNTWYATAGSGNVWKTTNAGTTWVPIFENYSAYSIGCVSIDPSNRHTVWVGTGENVGGRHVGYGDGVYRSDDGGKSFRNMGLGKSEHVARILIDPRDGDVVYVAAQGPLWSPGGERGLYKTTDGGGTWTQILAKGPYTGVTELASDPRCPDTIFAATHQRHRTVWSLVNGGPESGIHKSVDGGKSWKELKEGLPGEDKGKIALAVSPVNPDVVYASIELAGRTGGFWRSADRGETWTKMSDYISGGTGPHYYQEIFCDPHRLDVVYQADVRLGRTEDGGKTWATVESRWKHVDNHAVAFHPSDPDFLLVGCDGGLYRSYDRGETFEFFPNLPLTQFYKLDLDNDEPFYHIVGGTQDNATQYGPSSTGGVSGIRNSDWRILIGGDGHDCVIDPEDPNIIYCESQNGEPRRYDRRTGESVDIRPRPGKGEEHLRCNWDSPLFISPHSHTRVYFGSRKLHRSDDRGDSWTDVSPDLSRNLDRFKLPVMERVWSVDAVYDHAAMSQYGNVTSISESPLQEGLLYVGTDDGLIQITENGGRTWRKVERIYGIPEFAFVNDIKADLHEVDTVYAVFDNHKVGDFKPYLVKSSDRGRTWTSIAGDLPERHIVWRLEQDHVKKDLYFAGTEFGLFFTLDGGARWIQLKGGVPTISFRDIAIQRRENDLVGASFGRGFFVLDDYTPLRLVTSELLVESEFVLFPVKKPLLYIPDRPLGREKGSQGDGFFTAPNPPFGAVFTYYLRDGLQTRKQVRREQETKVKEAGGDNVYPGWEAIKKEDREEEPAITLTITDADGNLVNRVEGPISAGFHRVAWNLRYPAFTSGSDRSGPLVAPGRYAVRAGKRVDDVATTLGEPRTFDVVSVTRPSLPPKDRREVVRFQMQAGELHRAVAGANERAREVLEQLEDLKVAIRRTAGADDRLFESARALELKLMDARETLTGDPTQRRRHQVTPPSIRRRVSNALSGMMGTTYGPTRTHRREYDLAREEYERVIGELKSLVERDFAELQRQAEAAGVPWTPGRPIPTLRKWEGF